MSRDLLVCFSHLRWNFVFQRPQHLMTRAARRMDVLFIEEPLFRGEAAPTLDLHVDRGVTVAVPVLPERLAGKELAPVLRALVDAHLAEIPQRRRIYWYYTPMALSFSDPTEADVAIYDNMDELSAFRGAPQELIDFEDELFAQADLVFTGGQSLYEAKKGRHRAIHAFPSSIDVDHFAKARGRVGEPADQAAIPGPRIGFFAVMDERLDRDLVAALADRRPDWKFVMIGPVVKISEADLPRRANIHWLGGRAYDDLPAYLAGWDVAIMPFAINESTRFISPTKTPEFLAAGLPVVSTPVADVVRPYGEKNLVRIAADAAGFEAGIAAALQGAPTGWREAVDRHLAQGSWDRTFARMFDLVERARRPRGRTLVADGTAAHGAAKHGIAAQGAAAHGAAMQGGARV